MINNKFIITVTETSKYEVEKADLSHFKEANAKLLETLYKTNKDNITLEQVANYFCEVVGEEISSEKEIEIKELE